MKHLFLLTFTLAFCQTAQAQNEPLQPFEALGKTIKVLTLSNGKYNESFPNDSIMRIGSVLYNRNTGELVAVIPPDTLQPRTDVASRWLSIDPLAHKFAAWSPYNFVMNNPILMVDPDGREPIKPLVGTIQQAIEFYRLRGFTTIHQIQNFYANPIDENGKHIAHKDGGYTRYVYTEKNGWLDLRHVFSICSNGEAAMDDFENAQCLGGLGSCFSYEDLPSNHFGTTLSTAIKTRNGFLTDENLYNTLSNVFDKAGATKPENAPNYSQLPLRERPKVPDFKNNALLSDQDKQFMIELGAHCPQNFSEKPYNLAKFPSPAPSFLVGKYKTAQQTIEELKNKQGGTAPSSARKGPQE
jgi:hypothetical protein